MFPPPTPPIYRETRHTFHLLASLFTCGLWLMVWPCVWAANTISNGIKRRDYARQQRAFWLGQIGGRA